ncbi:MAG: hypothetical protein DPW16_10035 [Chloroflexi bacterium]|nr:hypothetical protein [Chloroflexota bacterium]
MNPIEHPKFRYAWLIRLPLLVIGLALIIAAHIRLQAYELWPELTSDTLIRLMPDNCEKLSLCRYPHVPFHLGNVLLVMAVGILLTIAGKPTASMFDDLPRPVEWKLHLTPSRWRVVYFVTAIITLLYSLRVMYPAISDKTLPDLKEWALNILLVGVVVYCRDRAAGNPSLLSRREVIWLVCYLLLLFGLGHLFGSFPTDNMQGRVVISGGAVYVLVLLWYHKILPLPVCILAFLAVAGIAVYTYRLDRWEYSFIGDEYAFYETARDYIDSPTPPHPLSDQGVYNHFSTFSTYIHVTTMRTYGISIYGWRISEVLMVVLAVPALYGLMRLFVSEYGALLAVVVYLTSHVVMAIAKIGYNNLQALPVVLTALGLMGLAIKRQNWLGIYLAGVVSTLAFYTFSLALPFIILPPLLLIITTIEKPKRWLHNLYAMMPQLAIFVLGFFVVFYPRVMETLWVDSIADKSVYNSEVNSDNHLRDQVLPNYLYTLTHSFSDSLDDHYVYGPHLDIVSSCLMLVGMGWLLSRVARKRIALFGILAFLFAAFIVGALVPYPYPVHTRTYFLVVFYALFAAFGFDFLFGGLTQAAWQQWAKRVIFVGLCVAIIALNFYQFYVLSKENSAQTPEAMMVREYQDAPADIEFWYITTRGYDFNLATVLRGDDQDIARFRFLEARDPGVTLPYIQNYAHAPYRILMNAELVYFDEWLAGLRRVFGPLTVEPIRDPQQRTYYYRVTPNREKQE